MKKKLKYGGRAWYGHHFWIKKLLVMKVIVFLLCVAGLTSSFADTNAQGSKLDFRIKKGTVKDVLELIEQQTGLAFMYDNDVLDVSREISVKVEGQAIDDVLDNLLGEDLKYEKVNRFIVISPKNQGPQQTKKVKGKVADTSGQPLPGVTVMVKGTTQGTVTDADGNYNLAGVPPDATLVFSFVGMKTQEVPVAGKTSVDMVLAEDAIGIEEVVAIGYGTQKRKDLTGSISRVKGEEMITPSTSTFDQMLQGKVAGLQITQTTGAPGGNVNMLVRGVSSITGGNQPLYVIDGFPVNISEGSTNAASVGTNTFSASGMANNSADRINPLASINPSDIESIEILKDASATAIYGSRSANGVVIITTKRGSIGQSQLNVDVSYGIQQVAHKLDLMNSQEYAELVCEGRDNAWVYAGGSADDDNDVRSTSYKVPDEFRDLGSITTNTDWQDVIFRVAPVMNYQLSASGGNEKLKYMVSGGYFHQEGIILTSDYRRFSLRTNLDAQIFENLKIGSTISGTYGYGVFPNTEGHYGLANALMQAMTASPTIPVYDENGDPYFKEEDVTNGLGWLVNPLTILNKDNYLDSRKKSNLMVNNYLEYRFFPGLTFKTTLGINYDVGSIRLWRSSAIPYYTTLNHPSSAGSTKTDNIGWLNENTLNYKRIFNEKHSMDGLLGFTAQKSTYSRLSAGATDFPTDYVTYIYAGTVNSGTEVKSEWSMLSMIARLNYSYNGKYMLTATIRRDGSSRFGANNRWGAFPSFSVGYNISEEPFIKELSCISNLKLRASYGISGNNQIGNYSTIGLLSSSNYVDGGSEISGLVPSSLSNDDLTWEKSKQFNVGLDLGLFNDRVSIIADIYKNKKVDLLLDVELPAASGFSSSTQNVGDIENKGIELALNTHNIKGRCFNWNSSFVFSANKNKVLKLATEGARINNNSYQVTEVGFPICSFYMYNAIGVFQSEEEVANSAIQHAKVQPGDLKFEDVSGDGEDINSSDKTIVGNPWPDYTWGFNNDFSYNNFSLSIALNGSHGAYTYNYNSLTNCAGVQNQLAIIKNRWRSETEPGDGRTPRAIRSNYAYSYTASTYYLYDSSYIRIKNINLSYTFPRVLINRLLLSDLTVYADVANVYTFTDYPGFDPDGSSYGNSITNSGIDYYTFPQARTYTFGVKLSF